MFLNRSAPFEQLAISIASCIFACFNSLELGVLNARRSWRLCWLMTMKIPDWHETCTWIMWAFWSIILAQHETTIFDIIGKVERSVLGQLLLPKVHHQSTIPHHPSYRTVSARHLMTTINWERSILTVYFHSVCSAVIGLNIARVSSTDCGVFAVLLCYYVYYTFPLHCIAHSLCTNSVFSFVSIIDGQHSFAF